MPPYESSTNVLFPLLEKDTFEKLVAPQAAPRQYVIIWKHVLHFSYCHLAAVYGLYLFITAASWPTIAFTCLTYYLSSIGVTAGAHRLWSHKAYKAKRSLQVFLMLCHSLANQYTIFMWARDHRLHHRYCDTDADPHNATRGFFFSHVGWILVERHPEMTKRAKMVDISDIIKNPIVMFQKRNRKWFIPLIVYIIPTFIPIYFWQESLNVAFHVNMFRYIFNLNAVFTINSLAHIFGTRPYDKRILPTQNMVTTVVTMGEGFHNYHHSFPYDYKAGELGSFLNFSTSFIDFCAWLGLVYDRRFASQDTIKQRIMRTGDGTYIGFPLEKSRSIM